MSIDLIPYAMDAASFLVQKAKRPEEIRSILLFGSGARGEAGKNSDVDLFIDVVRQSKNAEKEYRGIADSFLASAKCTGYWSLLGITNDLRLIVGELERWKGLKPSIIANGIVLYGKYKPEVRGGRHRAFFVWENVRPNAKRVLLNKQLLGYRRGGKFYPGLLQNYGGERLGKGCISVPLDHAVLIHALFRKHRVSVRIKKLVEYA